MEVVVRAVLGQLLNSPRIIITLSLTYTHTIEIVRGAVLGLAWYDFSFIH
jgi:hypothetical protein